MLKTRDLEWQEGHCIHYVVVPAYGIYDSRPRAHMHIKCCSTTSFGENVGNHFYGWDIFQGNVLIQNLVLCKMTLIINVLTSRVELGGSN